ncbi:MAG: nucleotidyltransferase domain-containing protein [Chloroflexota bacterium]|nr:nucleotidyltransferase domain-containing protein [Chloroflexota bacterium]
MNRPITQQDNDEMMLEIVRRIVSVSRPAKIILFGSRARGEARPDSDIDLLVITESEEPRYRRAAPLYGALSDIPIPMDVLVYRPQEVEEWSDVRQAFVTTAIREGKVLYEDPGRSGERLAAEGTK